MQEEYCKLLKVSRNTYYIHKRENRPMVALVEKYFSKDEINEFLKTGNIARLDDTTAYIDKADTLELLCIDNALFSAKEKHYKYIDGDDILDKADNYGAKKILRDILKSIKDDEFTIQTAKEFLLERIKGYEAKWLSLKNPNKVQLLSRKIEQHFSILECYAICKHRNIFIKYCDA